MTPAQDSGVRAAMRDLAMLADTLRLCAVGVDHIEDSAVASLANSAMTLLSVLAMQFSHELEQATAA